MSVVLGQINLIFFQNKDLFCPPRKTTVHFKTFQKHVTFPKFEMDKIEFHALRNVSAFAQVELIFIEGILHEALSVKLSAQFIYWYIRNKL